MNFRIIENSIAVFHPVRRVEIIGFSTDHAKNAGGMRRAMITEWWIGPKNKCK